jgi:hypothetical protein
MRALSKPYNSTSARRHFSKAALQQGRDHNCCCGCVLTVNALQNMKAGPLRDERMYQEKLRMLQQQQQQQQQQDQDTSMAQGGQQD